MPAKPDDFTGEECQSERVQSNTPNETVGEQMPSEILVHDPDYYIEDGSVVFLVDGVLFKVHKSRLTRDSSTFETLFDLPNTDQGQQPEGGDADPVVLQGDTPQQFRSLLWALYALPHDIIDSSTPNSNGDWRNFDRFCDLSLMAHKYGFESLERWALSIILRWLPFLQCKSEGVFAIDVSMPILERLRRGLALAVLCDDQKLHAAIILRLQDELTRPNPDLPWFIILAEEFQLHTLAGTAYYALMLQGRSRWIALAQEGRLTHQHLGRLHSGYYLLVEQ
ncbi:hypothetical protein BU17DRAFT_98015 [Hysterangium stoloniferum]|nr:hypothetical protein BU17DRAFT_98015 [Hysterangium stoloniferum]